MSLRQKIPNSRAAVSCGATGTPNWTAPATDVARQEPISLAGPFLPTSGMEFRQQEEEGRIRKCGEVPQHLERQVRPCVERRL